MQGPCRCPQTFNREGGVWWSITTSRLSPCDGHVHARQQLGGEVIMAELIFHPPLRQSLTTNAITGELST